MAGMTLTRCRHCGGTVLNGWESDRALNLPVRLDPRPVRTWVVAGAGSALHATPDSGITWRVREHDCSDPCPPIPDADPLPFPADDTAPPPF